MRRDNCPHCEADLLGDPIPQEYIDKGYYGTSTHWRREIGYEIPGVYDGVLYWVCPDCNLAWNRWNFPGAPTGRMVKAESYVVDHNEAVLSGKPE